MYFTLLYVCILYIGFAKSCFLHDLGQIIFCETTNNHFYNTFIQLSSLTGENLLERHVAPLERIKTEVRVRGFVAHIKSTLMYRNTSQHLLQVQWVLRKPPGTSCRYSVFFYLILCLVGPRNTSRHFL